MKQKKIKTSITEENEGKYFPTLSSFSKELAFRGIHPSIASAATAVSQEGQPAATCSPENPFGTSTISKLPSTSFGTPTASELSLFAPALRVTRLWSPPPAAVFPRSPTSGGRELVTALSCVATIGFPLLATSTLAATTTPFFESVRNRFKDFIRWVSPSRLIPLEQMQPIRTTKARTLRFLLLNQLIDGVSASPKNRRFSLVLGFDFNLHFQCLPILTCIQPDDVPNFQKLRKNPIFSLEFTTRSNPQYPPRQHSTCIQTIDEPEYGRRRKLKGPTASKNKIWNKRCHHSRVNQEPDC